jgi:hypothetical protein
MMSEQQMLDVMAWVDGELEGEDAARVEKLIEEDKEAAELAASLHAIGDGVRESFHVGSIDVLDAVMGKLRMAPNDLDKARLRRTARMRVAIVGASIVALAAAVLFYVRDVRDGGGSSQNPTPSASMLASSSSKGVEVDFVDTPSAVSVFYVPASMAGAEGQVTDTAPSVVVWVDDTAKAPEATP